jgi:hypothetical protein
MPRGVTARVADTVDGAYMWTRSEEEYRQTNRTTSLEGGLALMEDKLKEQVAALEFGTMFTLFGNTALHTHFPNIVMFAPKDHRMEVAMGKLPEVLTGQM